MLFHYITLTQFHYDFNILMLFHYNIIIHYIISIVHCKCNYIALM